MDNKDIRTNLLIEVPAIRTNIREHYTLPIANENELGGVKPINKTDKMTNTVGVDTEGKLYTEPYVNMTVILQTLLDIDINPNVYNKWNVIPSLKIRLATPSDNNIVNSYWIEFTSGSEPTTLLLPETIKWQGEPPTIEANKTYQINIENNLAVIGGF